MFAQYPQLSWTFAKKGMVERIPPDGSPLWPCTSDVTKKQQMETQHVLHTAGVDLFKYPERTWPSSLSPNSNVETSFLLDVSTAWPPHSEAALMRLS